MTKVKKRAKRIFCLLLSVIMLIGMMAGIDLTALAETSEDFEYQLLDDGTAEITGYTGSAVDLIIPSEIDGYKIIAINEWAFSECGNLVSVEIPESVINIGSWAFGYCENLQQVKLPSKITSIEMCVFSDCVSLVDIEIPEGVTYIGDDAFSGCSRLTNISLPNNLIFIGNCAFSGCSSLVSIEIPEAVVDIDDGAFSDCESLTSIKIPDNVTRIRDSVFQNCRGLIRVDLPEGLTEIEDYAFDGCSNLKSIEIPDSVNQIGNAAFQNCVDLTSIDIPDSIRLGDNSFKGCVALNNISGMQSVNGIGKNAFYETAYYKDISNWNDGVLYLGAGLVEASENLLLNDDLYKVQNGTKCVADAAFSNCDKLIRIDIPDSVISVGSGAFSGCTQLKDISGMRSVNMVGSGVFDDTAYYNDASNWDNDVLYVGSCLLEAKENITFEDGIYIVKDGTKCIAPGAFYYGSLTSVTFPEGLHYIGSSAFEGCDIQSLDFPESIQIIDSLAFAYCESLSSVAFPKQMEFLGGWSFRGTNLTNVTVPDGVVELDGAFTQCSELQTLDIPASVTMIDRFTSGSNADVSTGPMLSSLNSLCEINVSPDNSAFASVDGVLFNKSKTDLLYYPLGKTDASYTVPLGVERIGSAAFGNYYWGFCPHDYLKNLILPEGLLEIDDSAVISSGVLKSVTIPASVVSISDSAIDNTLPDYGGGESTYYPVTIYGYSDTAAQSYAKSNEYPFVPLARFADEQTGIDVFTGEAADSAFASDAHFAVETISTSKDSVVYDMHFAADDAEIQPDGAVTVKIPVPSGMDGAVCKVYRAETDGSYTDMHAVLQDGYLVFTTDHFSEYVVTTDNLSEEPTPQPGTLGDVDGNGVVNSADAVMVLRSDAGLITLTAEQAAAADVSGDGIVNASDAVQILRFDAGLIETI